MKLPFYIYALSLVYPVRIRKPDEGAQFPVAQLYYYRGRYQLATDDALYSDGDKYRPLTIAFNRIEKKLANIKEVLVLGTGLGSVVNILYGKHYYPKYTLVDIDKMILGWAMEFLPDNYTDVTPVHANAQEFIAENKKQYDLIVVDIFKGREVPSFVANTSFLQDCRRSMNPAAVLVLNYMVNDEVHWKQVHDNIRHVFPQTEVVASGINRILIATV